MSAIVKENFLVMPRYLFASNKPSGPNRFRWQRSSNQMHSHTMQPVPKSIAATLSERKKRTKLDWASMPRKLLNRRQGIEASSRFPEK